MCQHLPSLPKKTGNGPGPFRFFLLCALCLLLAAPTFFFSFCTLIQFLPYYPIFVILSYLSSFILFFISKVFFFFLIHGCLEVPYTLPHFPVASLVLNCIFVYPFFPGGGWQCSRSTQCTLTGEEDWRWQREWLQKLHIEPDLRVAHWQRSLTQALFSALSMAS